MTNNQYVRTSSAEMGETGNNPLYHSIDMMVEVIGIQLLSRDNLKYIDNLGEGAFGKVNIFYIPYRIK